MEGNNVETSACAPAGRASVRVGAAERGAAPDTRGSIVRAYVPRRRSGDAPVRSMPHADAGRAMCLGLLEGVNT